MIICLQNKSASQFCHQESLTDADVAAEAVQHQEAVCGLQTDLCDVGDARD